MRVQRRALGFPLEGHCGLDKNGLGAVRGRGSDELLQETMGKELVGESVNGGFKGEKK